MNCPPEPKSQEKKKLIQPLIAGHLSSQSDIVTETDAHKALLDVISEKCLPLSVTESSAMRRFTKYVFELGVQFQRGITQTRFRLPTSDTLKMRILSPHADRIRTSIRAQCAASIAIGALPSITADGWKAQDGQHYVGITLHFVSHSSYKINAFLLGLYPFEDSMSAEAYNERLQLTMAPFVNFDNICALTLDNCAAMIKLGSICTIPTHIRCAQHALQSCIETAIKSETDVKRYVDTSKQIALKLSSFKGKAALHRAQESLHKPKRSMIIACETRWDSEYDSILRLLEEWTPFTLLWAR